MGDNNGWLKQVEHLSMVKGKMRLTKCGNVENFVMVAWCADEEHEIVRERM